MDGDQQIDLIIVKPHVWPRDGTDAAVAVGVGCLQLLVLFLLPAIVVGVISRSLVVGILTYLALYGIWLLLSVTKLELSSSGIRFVRVLGKPKFLSWSEISSVAPASREEVVLHGWLWPPFPAREMTFSLSSLGHYAIRSDGRTTYYPPAEPRVFEQFVAKHAQMNSR